MSSGEHRSSWIQKALVVVPFQQTNNPTCVFIATPVAIPATGLKPSWRACDGAAQYQIASYFTGPHQTCQKAHL
jgi:hypothetical protein